MKLHGPSMFAGKAKIYEMLYNQFISIAFDENLVIGQRQKAPISRLFIGHHAVV